MDGGHVGDFVNGGVQTPASSVGAQKLAPPQHGWMQTASPLHVVEPHGKGPLSMPSPSWPPSPESGAASPPPKTSPPHATRQSGSRSASTALMRMPRSSRESSPGGCTCWSNSQGCSRAAVGCTAGSCTRRSVTHRTGNPSRFRAGTRPRRRAGSTEEAPLRSTGGRRSHRCCTSCCRTHTARSCRVPSPSRHPSRRPPFPRTPRRGTRPSTLQSSVSCT
jgi:hypothetical protein